MVPDSVRLDFTAEISLPNQGFSARFLGALVSLGCSAAPTPAPTRTPLPTLVPLPTATPAPTYTPYPTYTPFPTPTEAASPTPYPTLEPLPTLTPYPTLAALPTHTPYPTYTPYPTPVALPTYTPYPTLTPVPAPTASPTPRATATPRPTPKPLSSWRVLPRTTDPLTDNVSVPILTRATTYTEAPYSDIAPALILRCGQVQSIPVFNVNERVEVYIVWDRHMGAIDDFRGKLRWDDKEPVDSTWSESSSNEATFLVRYQVREFLDNAVKHDTLLVRIWDFSGEAYDAKFRLRGLEKHLKDNVDLCGWK